MAKASFSLDQFRSEVLDGFGLARTNRFEVDIQPPRALAANYGSISQVVSIYTEQAALPLLNIFTKSFKIFGPAYQRPIFSEYGGEGLPITFHVDRNMQVRKFFEEWMHKVVDPVTFTVGYQEDYITTVNIRQLDEENNVTYEVELLEAFPKNMNLIDLNNTATNQTHRLNVTFGYRYWRQPVKNQPVDIPQPITSPQIPRNDLRVPIVPPNPIVPSKSFGADSPAFDTQDKSNIGAAPAA